MEDATFSQGTNLYVCSLPLTITLKKFRLLFAPFGKIIGARLVPRRKGHPPVGFVQFTTSEMANAAIAAMHGKSFEGACLSVTMARRDKDKGISNQPSNTLYAANIPVRFAERDVKNLFAPFGMVHSVRLLRYSDTGTSKGIALVRFDTVEAATKAKAGMHCMQLDRQPLPLEVKYAESKEERLSRRDDPCKDQTCPVQHKANFPQVDPWIPSSTQQLSHGSQRRAMHIGPLTEEEWMQQWSMMPDDGWSWLDDPDGSGVALPDDVGQKTPETACTASSPLSVSSSHGCSSSGSCTNHTENNRHHNLDCCLHQSPTDDFDTVDEADFQAQLSKLEELSTLLALNWP